jgi:hypothetical protein
MNRCVAIHSNGTSEVIDVVPRVHRELRGLGYRRFVLRTADGRSPLTSAVYARITPTSWQITDAARRLWGRNTNVVQVFDEDGEPLAHDGSPGMTSGEMRAVDEQMEEPPAPATPRPVEEPLTLEPSPEPIVTPAMLQDLRLAAREIRGLLASRPVGLAEANALRALADRLEAHARALETPVTI